MSADRIQIERLVSNLLGNAIKYTPAGGMVKVSLIPSFDQVKLIVEDTGVGISPSHLPHIFDRFYRVPSADAEKGLGLGLSFVAWIAKAHGGAVSRRKHFEGRHALYRTCCPRAAGQLLPSRGSRPCPSPSGYTRRTSHGQS